MLLTYIFHSGFSLECENCTLIFDFWKDVESPEYKKGFVQQHLLEGKKRLYVFSSHSHKDHFNPEILEWKKKYPEITYLFSRDVLEENPELKEDAIFLEKGEHFSDDTLSVKAFGSTDLGISFLVSLKDKRIFHAGDLNNWHWSDESSIEESKEAELNYLKELEELKKEVSEIDLVMFPVDNRMGTDYDRGAKQFLEVISVHFFAPMHFGNQYDAANAFQETAEKMGAKFLKITDKGEQFKI
mgnify:CR=1 FL=1